MWFRLYNRWGRYKMTSDMASEDAKDVNTQAVEWHVRLTSGDASDDDWQAFAEWLVAAPEHQEAYNRTERLSLDLERASDEVKVKLNAPREEPAAHDTNIGVFTVWQQRPVQVAAAVAVLVLGVAIVFQLFLAGTGIQINTAAGDQRRITLDDGSKVSVDAGSSIEIQLKDDERLATMIQGAAVFDVARDPARPFTVTAGGQRIQVVGTTFEVESRNSRVKVAVAEGQVFVSKVVQLVPESSPVLLSEGQQIQIEFGAEPVIGPVLVGDVGAWSDGRLVFQGESLELVARRLNDYFEQEPFVLSGPDVSDLRFTGVLKISDAQSMAKRLEGLLPVRTRRDGNRILIDRSLKDDDNN